MRIWWLNSTFHQNALAQMDDNLDRRRLANSDIQRYHMQHYIKREYPDVSNELKSILLGICLWRIMILCIQRFCFILLHFGIKINNILYDLITSFIFPLNPLMTIINPFSTISKCQRSIKTEKFSEKWNKIKI